MATAAIFISIFFFIIVLPQTASSISESEALLLLKKSFTNTTSLISWVDGSAPCNGDNSGWRGLVCFHGIVTGLRLGEMGLSGKIDIDALLKIPGIRTLSFVRNSFAGSIPEFNRLGALKAIYLTGNQFSGEIPSDYFVKMESLKKVWLSDNKFSGKIPESIAKLPHLIELHLENNQFSGAMPDWIYPTLVSLNVSNNKLEGDRGASHAALDWSTRLKITQGIANGLLYIHTELSFSELPHGNLKASNILLTPNNDPLLSEFGYHPFTNSNQASTTLFAHKSPESLKNNQISPKSDVYCLGIIILEILTGKFPSQYNANGKGGIDIVQWVASSLSEEKVTELLDPEIANAEISSIVEMEKLLRIGAACTESNPEQRLDLREAVRLIEEVQIGETNNGDRDSVNNAAKTMQLLPSLRDGYADSALVTESSAAAAEATAATRTHRSTGSREGGYGELQRNDESFAFNVS